MISVVEIFIVAEVIMSCKSCPYTMFHHVCVVGATIRFCVYLYQVTNRLMLFFSAGEGMAAAFSATSICYLKKRTKCVP
jgi:hypothetical protein